VIFREAVGKRALMDVVYLTLLRYRCFPGIEDILWPLRHGSFMRISLQAAGLGLP